MDRDSFKTLRRRLTRLLAENRRAALAVAVVAVVALVGFGLSQYLSQRAAAERRQAFEALVGDYCDALLEVDGADDLRRTYEAAMDGISGRFNRPAWAAEVNDECGDRDDSVRAAVVEDEASGLCRALVRRRSQGQSASELAGEMEARIAGTGLRPHMVHDAAETVCRETYLAAEEEIAQAREETREQEREEDQAARQAELDRSRGWKVSDTHSCQVETEEHFSWQGRITNTDSVSHDYSVRVELVDAGGTRHGDGLDVVQTLAPGQTASWKAVGSYSSSGANGTLSCRILSVETY